MSLIDAATAAPAVSLAESRRYCEQLTRSEARNFYYGLKLLPQPQRSSMFALYAYMRLVDDIADGQDGEALPQRLEALDRWTQSTHGAIAGRIPSDAHAVWPAFAEMTRRHSVPGYLFDEVIAGQRQDLDNVVIENFDQLRQYCYRVAGVVGVASIHVFGFEGGQETIDMAVDRGIAFQLTNILRDLSEDADRGRIYLPREELSAAGVSAEEIRKGRATPQFLELMQRQIRRAGEYYDRSAILADRIDRASRPTLVAMTQIYHGLLQKIAADPARALQRRISLSPLSKLRIMWRAKRSS